MALRIAFVRPRLGMGGAERLVIDAARALGARGHEVAVFAPDRSSVPQFEDVLSPHFSWRSGGGWAPESVLGRLRAPMAVVRAYVAGWQARSYRPDVVIADVTSHIVAGLARSTRAPVIFYCHFPDALLTREGARNQGSYRMYRSLLDRMELRGLDAARVVLVNSAFTARRLSETFPSLRREVSILPPGVDVSKFEFGTIDPEGEIGIVAVSRIDPRKNLILAVEAFAAARRDLQPELKSRLLLHIAGRYDDRWPECRDTLASLKSAVARHGLENAVRFHLSPDDSAIRGLLARSRVVLYTPEREHFGYGPLEAMASGRPVIAASEGGPSETVVDGLTGFLRLPTRLDFAAALSRCILDPGLSMRLGNEGRKRVASLHSLEAFGVELERVCLREAGCS